MVVDRDRENLLGAILPHDIVVELLVERLRRRDGGRGCLYTRCGGLLFFDDLATQLNAFVADIHLVGTSNQPANFFLAFVTKGTPIMHTNTSWFLECDPDASGTNDEGPIPFGV
jgi:hypothetical protein